ncbi:Piso0_000928 [Millerozyma farinosa CBS 7064]|uniref:Piso0_000928 protein n=1 Tax=Pichia sorbitophila (strain ATCC MYA-4447 / BCRC 22081 / CBS 7064 / NBRC 10061 / NRRL Y-12695) TaxID=559304 RepID=G8YRX1_PICSO|nr:Piso0_000928 [Millerozyma farinosa CBS 7064]
MNELVSQEKLSNEDYADTIDCINRFKVPQAKDVARCLSLQVSGKKQEILERIIRYFEQGRVLQDNIRLLAVRTIVLKIFNNDPVPSYGALYEALRTGAYNYIQGTSQYQNKNRASSKHSAAGPVNNKGDSTPYRGHSLYFKESPFFKLKRMIHGSPQIAPPSKVKNICRFKFVLNEAEKQLLREGGEDNKVFVLCGVPNTSMPCTPSALIEFPIPVELHVNGTLMKDNIRGIKGKPGTSKPGNLTPYILSPPHLNKVEMAYAGTKESYLLYIYIVSVIKPETLLNDVLNSPHISREATISEIKKEYNHDDNESQDDDIMISVSSLSLKCPLTYVRMKYPAKSIFCKHIQCFDCSSYLQLQDQLPNWICPICSNHIELTHLAISDYFMEVLNNSSEEVESVNINPDGSWEPILNEQSAEPEKKKFKTERDDNFIESTIPKSDSFKKQNTEPPEIISLDSESEDETTDNVNIVGNTLSGNNTDTSNNMGGSRTISADDNDELIVSSNDSMNTVPRTEETERNITFHEETSNRQTMPNLSTVHNDIPGDTMFLGSENLHIRGTVSDNIDTSFDFATTQNASPQITDSSNMYPGNIQDYEQAQRSPLYPTRGYFYLNRDMRSDQQPYFNEVQRQQFHSRVGASNIANENSLGHTGGPTEQQRQQNIAYNETYTSDGSGSTTNSEDTAVHRNSESDTQEKSPVVLSQNQNSEQSLTPSHIEGIPLTRNTARDHAFSNSENDSNGVEKRSHRASEDNLMQNMSNPNQPGQSMFSSNSLVDVSYPNSLRSSLEAQKESTEQRKQQQLAHQNYLESLQKSLHEHLTNGPNHSYPLSSSRHNSTVLPPVASILNVNEMADTRTVEINSTNDSTIPPENTQSINNETSLDISPTMNRSRTLSTDIDSRNDARSSTRTSEEPSMMVSNAMNTTNVDSNHLIDTSTSNQVNAPQPRPLRYSQSAFALSEKHRLSKAADNGADTVNTQNNLAPETLSSSANTFTNNTTSGVTPIKGKLDTMNINTTEKKRNLSDNEMVWNKRLNTSEGFTVNIESTPSKPMNNR